MTDKNNSADEIAVEVEYVFKHFNAFQAVSDLSFCVPKATCFALLGPNGAGKTTMMNMLIGRILRDKISHSKISVLGYDPNKNELEIKYNTGIVPQENNLDVELTVIENLMVYSKFYGIPKKEASKRIHELLSFMELSEKRSSLIKQISGGMQRRLIIARALLNAPCLLILDEPTTGLDPQVRQAIWDKLRILKASGVTILLTTHYMDEAHQLCDNLLIMHQGKKIIEGNPHNLIRDHMEAYVLEIINKQLFNDTYCNTLRCERTATRLMLYTNQFEDLQTLSKTFGAADYVLRPTNLEDLFLKVTGRGLNDG
ncbi:MAG: ABC transporter ATP-binding protein [Proteobacteria bacterium]|nr:ABC transporter ATP-binding protein [Pseudomonadota bacterium]